MHFQGQAVKVTMDRNLYKRMNSFCTLNNEMIRKWVTKDNERKEMIIEEITLFCRRNDRRIPILNHLYEFPKTITCDCVNDKMEMMLEEDQASHITYEEYWEYARGLLPKVTVNVFVYVYVCICTFYIDALM